MAKIWKFVFITVALALVLALGVMLVPSMITNLAVANTEPPPPPPPPPPSPVAGFSGQPTMGEEPLVVQFRDRSISYGDVVSWSWSWDFGDGQRSSQQNPSHTYYTEGFYRVREQITVTVMVPEETEEGYVYVPEERTATHYMDVIVDAGAAPPRLSVHNLRIEPTYGYPNQPVTIYADVVNTGGSPGSQTISLIINGYFEQSRGVGVSPGTAYPVSFTVYKATPGTYSVAVGDAVAWFYVMQPQ